MACPVLSLAAVSLLPGSAWLFHSGNDAHGRVFQKEISTEGLVLPSGSMEQVHLLKNAMPKLCLRCVQMTHFLVGNEQTSGIPCVQVFIVSMYFKHHGSKF